jgi:hypothetical protein
VSAGPNWAGQPVPPNVLRTWPSVRTWTWESPLRLRGEHELPGAAYLVVIDEGRTDALGQAVSAAKATDPDYVRDTYAQLRMALMRNIGHRDACRDGTPVCREDDGRCHYCGLAADEHEAPGSHDGPLRQETHVGWPGAGVSTTSEFEAAFYVEMEAMKLRGSPGAVWPDEQDDPEAGQ